MTFLGDKGRRGIIAIVFPALILMGSCSESQQRFMERLDLPIAPYSFSYSSESDPVLLVDASGRVLFQGHIYRSPEKVLEILPEDDELTTPRVILIGADQQVQFAQIKPLLDRAADLGYEQVYFLTRKQDAQSGKIPPHAVACGLRKRGTN